MLTEAEEKYSEAESERLELRGKFAKMIGSLEVQNNQYESRIETLQHELSERTVERDRVREQLAI